MDAPQAGFVVGRSTVHRTQAESPLAPQPADPLGSRASRRCHRSLSSWRAGAFDPRLAPAAAPPPHPPSSAGCRPGPAPLEPPAWVGQAEGCCPAVTSQVVREAALHSKCKQPATQLPCSPSKPAHHAHLVQASANSFKLQRRPQIPELPFLLGQAAGLGDRQEPGQRRHLRCCHRRVPIPAAAVLLELHAQPPAASRQVS